MSRDYWFAFGSRPAANSGLSPTFITFVNGAGATIAPPTITETFVGSGLYRSNYNATQTISFVLDGATTGLSDSIRYIMGVMDPQDTFGVTLVNTSNRTVTLIAIGSSNIALGTSAVAQGVSLMAIGSTILATELAIGQTAIAQGQTLIAIGNTLLGIDPTIIGSIGSTASPFGDSVAQPVTVFGYLKRLVEFLEGNQAYAKATGVLNYSARGGQTLLASKTISDSTSSTTRS